MSTETISYGHYTHPETVGTVMHEVPSEPLLPAYEPSLEREICEAELEAEWSADALLMVEERYGPEIAQYIVDWCAEQPDQPPYKVIDNIVRPLSVLMLGFTVSRGEESLDGLEITDRLRRASVTQATRSS